MSRLLGFLWRSSAGTFALAVAAGVASGAGGVGLLAMLARAVRPGAAPSGRVGLVFAGVCLATVLARLAMNVAMVRIAQGSVARLVRGLCASALDLPLREFERHDPGRFLAVLTDDVATLAAALTAIPPLLINLTVLVGCFVYLGQISPVVLACTLAFTVPAVASHQWLVARGGRLMALARAEHDALAGHFRQLVEGFKELKLHRERREAFLEESIRAASARARARNTAGYSLFAVVGGWGQLLYFGYLGFLAFGLPPLVGLPREALAAAVLTVLFANSPLDSLLMSAPVVARAGASLGRIEALGLSLKAEGPAITQAEGRGAPLGPMRRPLVLRGVTYEYPAEDQGEGEGFTLGPIDLTVLPGELLFLAGGNGSGKTTLVKLLTGLYPPSAGSVRYNGATIDRATIENYRGLFTAVFADGFLFPTLLGLAGPDLDARAAALVEELGLRGVVRVEAGAFSTVDLSQGQRKRLALLGACLEDRPILVLDEWASYQDPAFKRVFYREILPRLKARGKTMVVISHDEDFFDVADRVVHLTGGVVAAAGPPVPNPNPDPNQARSAPEPAEAPRTLA
jgi:putative ATP-binding cassette transporter